MRDRQPFEDMVIVEQYLAVVPELDSASVDRVRHQLETLLVQPSSFRRHRLRAYWPGALASIALAMCVAIAAIVLPLRPSTARPANAQALLQKLLQEPVSVPYTGAARITFTSSDIERVLPAIEADRGPHVIMTRFHVLSSTHYRVDARVVSPAIESGTQTVLVNGASVLLYNDSTGQSVRGAFDQRASAFWLSVLQSGRGVPLFAQTLRGIVAGLNHSYAIRATVIGTGNMAGRVADIVQISPAVTIMRCEAHRTRCVPREHGYGQEKLWIDHAHAVLLAYDESGVPSGMLGADFSYRVTSISFRPAGSGPTLSFHPPVAPISVGSRWPQFLFDTPGVNSSLGKAGLTWPDISGLISAPAPIVNGTPFTLFATTIQQVPAPWRPGWIDGLYVEKRPVSLEAPGIGVNLPSFIGPYVDIREQVHRNGVPAKLRRGKAKQISHCRVWTGTSTGSGDSWLALSRGPTVLLANAHGLSQLDLLHYARQSLCS